MKRDQAAITTTPDSRIYTSELFSLVRNARPVIDAASRLQPQILIERTCVISHSNNLQDPAAPKSASKPFLSIYLSKFQHRRGVNRALRDGLQPLHLVDLSTNARQTWSCEKLMRLSTRIEPRSRCSLSANLTFQARTPPTIASQDILAPAIANCYSWAELKASKHENNSIRLNAGVVVRITKPSKTNLAAYPASRPYSPSLFNLETRGPVQQANLLVSPMQASYGNSRKWESKEYAEARKDAAEERKRRLTATSAQQKAQDFRRSLSLHTPKNSWNAQHKANLSQQTDPDLYSPESQHSTVTSEDLTTTTMTKLSEDLRDRSELDSEIRRFERIKSRLLSMYGNPKGDIDPIHRYDPKYKRHKVANFATSVPWTFDQWLEHQKGIAEAQAVREFYNMKRIEQQAEYPLLSLPFGGKKINDNRGMVLAEQTIWCPRYSDPNRWGGHVWPPGPALLFEGDQRQASAAAGNDFRRFLPLVRHFVEGNNTVRWEMLKKLEPYPFDQTWKAPEMPDIYFERDEVLEEDVPYLLNYDLFIAMEDIN